MVIKGEYIRYKYVIVAYKYMQDFPPKVSESFASLKRKYPFYISLKIINSKYYVYKVKAFWNKQEKKPNTISEYLGRILEDGSFLEKTSRKSALDRARELIEARGGKVVWTGEKSEPPAQAAQASQLEMSEAEKKILMALSMNARAPLQLIGGIAGLKPTAVAYHIEKLEKRYGIRYFAEIDVTKLGYAEFIIFVKFEDKKPGPEEIKAALGKDPRVQLVMVLNGDYDLFIYYVVENDTRIATKKIYEMQKSAFPSYKAQWYSSIFDCAYGCVPLRDKFFAEVLKEKIKSADSRDQRQSQSRLLNREYAVLKELSNNGKEEFTAIDERYGFDRGRSNYTFDALKERRVIKRVTLTMGNLPIRHLELYSMSIVDSSRFDKSRQGLLEYVIGEQLPTNRFALEGNIFVPNGIVFAHTILKDNELEKTEGVLKGIEGTACKTMIIRETVLGELCYRLFDNAYSNQSEILEQYYGAPKSDEIKYEKGSIARRKSKADIRGVLAAE